MSHLRLSSSRVSGAQSDEGLRPSKVSVQSSGRSVLQNEMGCSADAFEWHEAHVASLRRFHTSSVQVWISLLLRAPKLPQTCSNDSHWSQSMYLSLPTCVPIAWSLITLQHAKAFWHAACCEWVIACPTVIGGWLVDRQHSVSPVIAVCSKFACEGLNIVHKQFVSDRCLLPM